MAKIPDSIGPYKVTSSLGRGGTSQVYRAVHPTLKKTVVLKKLTLGRGVTLQKRFQREADLMMTLNHPNIVRVFDFFKEGRSWVIVQEYVEGLNLDQLIHLKGHLNSHLASWIMLQCARALHFIHRQGIIHRDIKPSNIFISKEGLVKLGDFGIAARIDDSQGLTREGAALGTPDYMPPEQILNPASVDQRADIYALGVSYFEAIYGDRYTGDTRIRLKLLLSFSGRTILKAVRKKTFFRYRNLRIMKLRLFLSGWGSRRSNRKKLKFAMDEGRKGKEDFSKRSISSLLMGIILPFFLLLLPLAGFPLWKEVIRAEHYGRFQLVLPLSEENHSWLKDDITVRLHLQRGESLQSSRKLRLNAQSGEDWTLASRPRTIPSGYYRLEMVYQGRIEWSSFYLNNRLEQKEGSGPLVLHHPLLPVQALPLRLETRIRDCFSGNDLRSSAEVDIWDGSESWIALGQLTGELETGRSYTLRVRVPGYQDFYQTQYFDVLQTRGRWDIAMIPRGGRVHLMGESGEVGLKINGQRQYLSLKGAPRLLPLRFDGEPLTLLPGSYRLDFSYLGRLYPLSIMVRSGRDLEVHWVTSEDSLDFQVIEK